MRVMYINIYVYIYILYDGRVKKQEKNICEWRAVHSRCSVGARR